MKHKLSLLLIALAACTSDVSPPPETRSATGGEASGATIIPDAIVHKGAWPLIADENPRTVWMGGVWGMKTPNCHREEKPISTLIMNYSDLNMEYNAGSLEALLGPYLWAWSGVPSFENEPDSFDGDNDIKVIVYRNILSEEELMKEYWPGSGQYAISLEDVKILYVTDQEKQLDFRYLAYTDALNYLGETAVNIYREDAAIILLRRKFEIKGMFCKAPH